MPTRQKLIRLTDEEINYLIDVISISNNVRDRFFFRNGTDRNELQLADNRKSQEIISKLQTTDWAEKVDFQLDTSMIKMKNIKTQEISWIDKKEMAHKKKFGILLLSKYKLAHETENVEELVNLDDLMVNVTEVSQ